MSPAETKLIRVKYDRKSRPGEFLSDIDILTFNLVTHLTIHKPPCHEYVSQLWLNHLITKRSGKIHDISNNVIVDDLQWPSKAISAKLSRQHAR